jgi:hypothetical protein
MGVLAICTSACVLPSTDTLRAKTRATGAESCRLAIAVWEHVPLDPRCSSRYPFRGIALLRSTAMLVKTVSGITIHHPHAPPSGIALPTVSTWKGVGGPRTHGSTRIFTGTKFSPTRRRFCLLPSQLRVPEDARERAPSPTKASRANHLSTARDVFDRIPRGSASHVGLPLRF